MTFEEFKSCIAQGLASGAIKTDVELTELDLALQYVIGKEQTARVEQGIKEELLLTSEDLAALILKYCGKDVYDRVLSEV